ncbi:MAG TPA: CopG family transcriptional regulator, partial [bacterium]
MEDPTVVKIEILKEYYTEIEKIIARSTQFQSVSDYVNFVLKEVLSANDRLAKSHEDDEALKKRLEDLG